MNLTSRKKYIICIFAKLNYFFCSYKTYNIRIHFDYRLYLKFKNKDLSDVETLGNKNVYRTSNRKEINISKYLTVKSENAGGN